MTQSTLPRFMGLLSRLSPQLAVSVAAYWATRPARQIVPQHSMPMAAGEWVTFRFGQRALRWGTEGEPVLLVHGWQGHPDQFRALANALVGDGYQVFALNGPGHGQDTNGPVHPGLFADYIHDMVAELRGVKAVIGHSMGGGATLMALAQGVLAERAVVIASPYSFQHVVQQRAQRLGFTAKAQTYFSQRMQRYVGAVYERFHGDHLLPNVAVPLLVVHDEDDKEVCFTNAQALVAGCVQAEIHATKGLGHGRIVHNDDVIQRVLKFLR